MTGRRKKITGRRRWKTTAEERWSNVTCSSHIEPEGSMEDTSRSGVSMNHTIAGIRQDMEMEAINRHRIIIVTEPNSHNGLRYCYDRDELAKF